jgi:hypothetical protein
MATNIKYNSKNIYFSDLKIAHATSVFLKYRKVVISLAFLLISMFAVGFFSFSVFFSFFLFGILGIFLSLINGAIGVKIFSLIYSFSTLFAIFFYFIFLLAYGIPYGGGGSDSLAYEQHAEIVAKSIYFYDSTLIGLAIDQPYHNSKGYIYFISLLMRFFDCFGGFHTMVSRLFNCFLLGICSVITFNISRKIGLSLQQSLNSALVTGLFPIMIYVADQSLRDIPILFLLLLSVNLSIIFLLSQSIIKQTVLILCFIPISQIMLELRMLNVINIGLILFFTISIKIFSIKRFSNKYIFIVFILAYFSYIFINNSQFDLFINLVSKLDASGNDLAEGVERAAQGGLSLMIFNLPQPFNYIGSLFYSFITPLPIIYINYFDWNFLSLGTIYQFLFIPFVFAGIKYSYRYNLMLPILFMFLITFGGYVFGSFTFRHITYFIPFAAIYGVIGFEKLRKYRWIIWPLQGLFLFLLVVIYYIIKY